MEVSSFGINHDLLLRGVYVSRKDAVGGDTVTTFDIRMKEPNRESVMDTSVMHTLEHLMAVYIRSYSDFADKAIYIGPMGCRTGMYLLFKGDLEPEDIVPLLIKTYEYIVDYTGEIPATKPNMCGNYLDHNLKITQIECKKFLDEVLKNIKKENLTYPMESYE